MLSLPFLHRLQATAPLTEECMHRVLRTAGFTVSYRFRTVLAVDTRDQHYYLSRQAQLATMTIQQFTEALKLELSFRLPEPGHIEDPCEEDLA